MYELSKIVIDENNLDLSNIKTIKYKSFDFKSKNGKQPSCHIIEFKSIDFLKNPIDLTFLDFVEDIVFKECKNLEYFIFPKRVRNISFVDIDVKCLNGLEIIGTLEFYYYNDLSKINFKSFEKLKNISYNTTFPVCLSSSIITDIDSIYGESYLIAIYETCKVSDDIISYIETLDRVILFPEY